MAVYDQPEYKFSLDDYSKVDSEVGLMGLAIKLQNLILTEPNTYPSSSDFGVGIGLYLFEKANENTFSEIKTKINEQISKYLPDAPIQEIILESAKDFTVSDKVGEGLLLGFSLSENIEGDDLIGFTFHHNSQNNIISQILLG